MAHAFDRVGNAPRFAFQISHFKSQIRNFKQNNRGPPIARLDDEAAAMSGLLPEDSLHRPYGRSSKIVTDSETISGSVICSYFNDARTSAFCAGRSP